MKIDTTALLDNSVNIVGTAKAEESAVSPKDQEVFFVREQERLSGVFGDATYGNPKKDGESIIEDIANQAEVSDATQMKNEMLFAVNTTSEKDSEQLEEDGFSLNSTKIETIVTETDKIKAQLAKAGVDISIFGDDLSSEQLEEIAGNAALAQQMEALLSYADLPATEQNLADAKESLAMAKELTELSDGAVKYMLDNHLEPTIENLYKAEYSGSNGYSSAGETYEDGALRKQIEGVIEEAGYEVTAENVKAGEWMLANQIPLTAENFAYMQKLKELQLPADDGKVMTAMVQAIAEGARPADGVLIEGYTLAEKAKHAADVVERAEDEDLEWLVENDMELTVENLEEAAVHRQENVRTDERTPDQALALLTARRQLEEVRLAMTAQANYALLKQGISIDTKPLAELVDALRAQENSYYEKLLVQADISADEANVSVFQETLETVEGLKSVPAYVLGIPKAGEEALKDLYQRGRELQDTLDKAGERYETMMTRPRADMGDAIQKAFANVDDILRDLGLETSRENQRAVRILAYNQMDITQQAILQTKAIDEAVARTFKNMTPSVVREMIKEQMNPLDMNIEELNRKAENIKEELGIEEEDRFSKYLWKLDKSGEISEEERSAFLGVYRLITQVEKSDGAAIGALMEQGLNVTMRNLLTQVRSSKHENKEYVVDDAFSGVDSVKKGLSITEQIEMGYQADCMRDVLDEITPDKMAEIMKDTNWQEMTPEQLARALAGMGGEEKVDEEYRKEQLANFEAAAAAPEEVYQMLAEYDLPDTAEYVLAACEWMKNRNKAYAGFFAQPPEHTDGKEDVDFSEIKQELLERFAEAVKTPEEMAKAQKALADTAENVMKTMINRNEDVTNIDLRQMKMLNAQIEIGTRQAKEETYAIPVLIADEVTNVTLKIVRGKEKKGMIDIMFSTDKLGRVAAQLKASKDGISGYVACEKSATAQLLAGKDAQLAAGIRQGEEDVDIRYVTSDKLDLATFGKEDVSETKEREPYMTKTLYRMAESFLKTVKTLEA